MAVNLTMPGKGTKELSTVVKALQKKFGDKAIVTGSSIPRVKRLPTGLFEFDMATGGGFPFGRISIIYGPESSGKTNLMYKAVAQVQQMPGPNNIAVWVDLEHVFDPEWAQQFGVDTDALVVVRPGYGEQAVDMIEAITTSEEVALVVVDSIAHLVSAKVVEDETEKQQPGKDAMLAKKLCLKLVVRLSEESKRDHFPAVVLINQTRFKIGVMYGDPETMPGGNTVKFVSSLTVRIWAKPKTVKELHPELPVYKETAATIKKAKVGVLQEKFVYDMAVHPLAEVPIGETNSWNVVSHHLKAQGVLTKGVKAGWELFDVPYPTLMPIEQQYRDNQEFRLRCQQTVIDGLSGKMFVIEAKEEKDEPIPAPPGT